jgi:hypothetical protein
MTATPMASQQWGRRFRLPTRLLVPSVMEVFFAAMLVVLLAPHGGPEALLADGDTGWHIRTGQRILSAGAVPRGDPFSFTRPGQPWFAWEWLADVLFAGAFRLRGLAGVVALAAVVLALAAAVLFAWLLRRGAGLWIGLAVTLAAASASSLHYLARPHVFSILLYTVSLAILDADRASPRGSTWWLVPLCGVWANLHAGFAALPATLALAAAVEVCRRRFLPAARYGAMALACLAASGLNPYGFRLHLHIARYLGASWVLDHVQEFQSPSIRSEGAVVFALLLLAGAAAAGRRLRTGQDPWEAALIFAWGYLALRSARSIPFFAMAAAPAVADAVADWCRARAAASSAASPLRILWESGRDLGRPRAPGVWLAAAAAAGMAMVPACPGFPEGRFPVRAVEANLARLGGRVLTSDQWADYLIYRGDPAQRVFFDGRSDFYGPALGEEYRALLNAGPGWREALGRHRFDAALLPRDWPLSGFLDREPGWRRVYEDRSAVVFENTGGG